MDTDDLSREAYKAIIVEAEKLSHDLTLRYGLLSKQCKDETEYLDRAEQLTKEFSEVDDDRVLNDLFWGDPPDKDRLALTLAKILNNIEKVKAIPMDKRKFDF